MPTLGSVSGLRPVKAMPPGVKKGVSRSRARRALNHSNVAAIQAPESNRHFFSKRTSRRENGGKRPRCTYGAFIIGGEALVQAGVGHPISYGRPDMRTYRPPARKPLPRS